MTPPALPQIAFCRQTAVEWVQWRKRWTLEEFSSGLLQAAFFCVGLLYGQLLCELLVRPLWSPRPDGLSIVFWARGYSGTLLVMLLCEKSGDCDPNQILTGGIERTLAGGTVTGCEFTNGRLQFDGSCEDAAQKLLKESPQNSRERSCNPVRKDKRAAKHSQFSASFLSEYLKRRTCAARLNQCGVCSNGQGLSSPLS